MVAGLAVIPQDGRSNFAPFVSSIPPTFAGLEKVPIHDADGNHAYDASPAEARALLEEGLGRPFGSTRRKIGVVLFVDLEEVRPDHMQRSMSPEGYGKRYVFEEHLLDRLYVYSFTDFDQAGRNCLLRGRDFLQVARSAGARMIRRTIRYRRLHDASPARHHGYRRLVPPGVAAPRGPAAPER